ncbi:hypothetical protein [Shewanella glacialipiscicola]|uniref:Uncharacterized protein n=1 Tax=Shewanella glacialipiscicola TaxID=614069 RepID=A0ABQ6J8X5_9GAMM|nr:hypothetical protein [Shewanella glacialipiscicola]MCL1086403.1 hypothetical protein [Shewanella glacialipiscicola]MCU7995323.1 hypothetical protein [Shewanella glacialipiscicola]MCU8026666.1 hypothetical protein [Shewanella glacialipiscicola]GIU08570.1 hypothetical protein TUM4636_13400 [Shewanella glacialipiscicola]GMA84194.1 hypothetical protein GCM10025855_37270 [Shewanella glacialipiscicola]
MKGQFSQFLRYVKSVTFKSSMMVAFTVAVVATLAFGVEKITENTETASCACNFGTRYNTTLPSSHPNNRCSDQAQTLSWKTWFTGKNRSSQFHFVDLLELLYGHQDKPMDDLKPTTSHLSY